MKQIIQKVREKCNTLLQTVIRLCALTAVTFTVTACYAPAYPDDLWPEMPEEEQQERIELQQQVEAMAETLDNSINQ